MNIFSQKSIAALIAIFSTLLCVLGAVILPPPINGWVIFAIVVGVFILLYSTISGMLRLFVIRKIQPIYKTIYSLENIRKDLRQKKDKDSMVDRVALDVMDWAAQKAEEVSHLSAMEQYRKEFLGNVSHELKTPIFNIQGYLLTLLDGGLEDPSINRKYLERAETSLERLIAIVRDLEYISNLETGEMQLEPTNFNIVRLVQEILDSFEINAKNHNVTLRLDPVSGGKIMVYADRQRIAQVLTNLISNSINYGKPDGETSVRFSDVPDRIMVEVRDNGIGIENDKLPHIFERFYRVDKHRSRENGGSGLGLAIVKHNIEAHGQSINVQSELGKGSSFFFTLKKGK